MDSIWNWLNLCIGFGTINIFYDIKSFQTRKCYTQFESCLNVCLLTADVAQLSNTCFAKTRPWVSSSPLGGKKKRKEKPVHRFHIFFIDPGNFLLNIFPLVIYTASLKRVELPPFSFSNTARRHKNYLLILILHPILPNSLMKLVHFFTRVSWVSRDTITASAKKMYLIFFNVYDSYLITEV